MLANEALVKGSKLPAKRYSPGVVVSNLKRPVIMALSRSIATPKFEDRAQRRRYGSVAQSTIRSRRPARKYEPARRLEGQYKA